MNSVEELSLDSALIFDEKRIQLGYDGENIRKFIPKEIRKVEARQKITQLRKLELLAG